MQKNHQALREEEEVINEGKKYWQSQKFPPTARKCKSGNKTFEIANKRTFPKEIT